MKLLTEGLKFGIITYGLKADMCMQTIGLIVSPLTARGVFRNIFTFEQDFMFFI